MNPLTRSRTTSNAKLALLRKVPTLAACSDRELGDIARHVDESTAQVGDVLVREGTTGQQAFIIVDGWASVTVQGELVAQLGPGEFVGEMAMLDRGPRSATVVATTPMQLLVVGPGAFEDVVANPTVAGRITRELAGRLRRADARLRPIEADETR